MAESVPLIRPFPQLADEFLSELFQDFGVRPTLGNIRTSGLHISWTRMESNNQSGDVLESLDSQVTLYVGLVIDRDLYRHAEAGVAAPEGAGIALLLGGI